jgi:amidohydrolase
MNRLPWGGFKLMRHSLLSALVLALPAAQAFADTDVNAWAQPVDAKVQNWRRDFHQFPELGNREFRTAKTVAQHLKSLGLEVSIGIAHTGVTAVLKGGKPGPRIALRADMDALPVTESSGLPFESKQTAEYRGEKVGVMHACGHDAHTAVLMGVAEVLAKHRSELPGEVLFIFQPAEEGAPDGETGGAEQMLAEGLFKSFKPEAVFGLHVWSALNAGQIGYRAGPAMAAVDSFNIVVQGQQTHGAKPWAGIDPIVTAAELVTSTQTIVSRKMNLTQQPVVLSFGAIKGGIRSNIIPDSVELIGTIRTFDEGMRQSLFSDFRTIAEHVAAAHGAKAIAQIPFGPSYPKLVNDPELTARMLPGLKKVAGAGVVEMDLLTVSEDFAFFSNEVPGFYFFIGSTPKGGDAQAAPSNHSPKFFLDESSLPLATRALLQVSVDYLHGTR